MSVLWTEGYEYWYNVMYIMCINYVDLEEYFNCVSYGMLMWNGMQCSVFVCSSVSYA
jgi:hypothetical protein